MWELYDELIAEIPENLSVKHCVAGSFWTAVESEAGVGIAVTPRVLTRPRLSDRELCTMTLKEAAELSKSWNLVEAGIGIAAINAWYNTPTGARVVGVSLPTANADDRLNDPYIAYQSFAAGKKVAGVGHSQYLEALMGPICELSLIGAQERGNYPISALDYLLPEQDLIYLPCTSIISKELPHWLELCSRGRAIICGPSIPMTPVLFDYGAFDLSGFVVTNGASAIRCASGTGIEELFLSGKKVSLRKEAI